MVPTARHVWTDDAICAKTVAVNVQGSNDGILSVTIGKPDIFLIKTLNMLNYSKDYERYTCIHSLNRILDLAWPK